MILLVLALMMSLGVVAGLSGPMAVGEIRAGRQAFFGVEVHRAASGALAEWIEAAWIDSTVGRLPGAVVVFPDDRTPSGIVRSRRAECVAPNLWLIEAVARRVDQAGRVQAAARLGWLVRTGVPPGDSLPRFRVTERARMRGFSSGSP